MCSGVGAFSARLLTYTHVHTRLRTVVVRQRRLHTFMSGFCLALALCATFGNGCKPAVCYLICTLPLCFLNKNTISKFNNFSMIWVKCEI